MLEEKPGHIQLQPRTNVSPAGPADSALDHRCPYKVIMIPLNRMSQGPHGEKKHGHLFDVHLL
jgi:hypothetical protein